MTNLRRVPRRSIAAEVKLRRSGEMSYAVRAYDLSGFGCKVELVERPREGEIVWVKFEGLEGLESIVRWTRDSFIGLEFTTPIDERVVQLLFRRFSEPRH